MLKLCRVTKVKGLFLVLVYVFNFDLFAFSAAILENSKGLFFSIPHRTKLFEFFCNKSVKKSTSLSQSYQILAWKTERLRSRDTEKHNIINRQVMSL